MLSKKAIDMLDYNGYSIKSSSDHTIFKKNGTDRIGLIVLIIISLVLIGVIFTIKWWVGLLAFIIGFLVFRPLVKRIPGSLTLVADNQNKRLELNDRSISLGFDEIKSVYIHSKFVDEYASAFKSTSEEHQITIGLETDANSQIPLFKLISDHAKPSKEMNEVHDFLQQLFGRKNID